MISPKAFLRAFFIGVMGFFLVFRVSLAAEEKPRVAVLDFKLIGVEQVSGVFLVDKLRSDLVQTGKYTVLDRGQTDKIVEELARQQQGLSDEKTAIQIGKQFNVQRIVTGRVAANPRMGLIQVNAEMIDMESAVILHSETITHDGDMKGFILSRVPSLAAKLAGLAQKAGLTPATEPAVPSNNGPTSPATGTAPKVKLALFPALFQGNLADRLQIGNPGILRWLDKALEKNAERLVATHSFYPLQKAENSGFLRRDFGEMEEAWSGTFFKEPNEKFIYKVGRRLGVDVVLLYESTANRGSQPSFKVYLVDVNRLQVFAKDGTWEQGRGNFHRAVAQGIAAVLRQYRKSLQ